MKKLKNNFSVIRILLKKKEYKKIVFNPKCCFFFILFVARALILRLTPHITEMFFIQQSSNKLTLKPLIEVQNYTFKKINYINEEIIEYIRTRYNNDGIPEIQYYKEIDDRFKEGHYAYVLFYNNKIICVFFATNKSMLIKDINYTYYPSSSEIIIYDIYTIKEERGKGLYIILLNYFLNELKSINLLLVTMWIMKHNKATINAQIRGGFENTFQKVICFTWFGLNKTSVKKCFIKLNNL